MPALLAAVPIVAVAAGAVLVGIVGSSLGFWLAGMLGFAAAGTFARLVVSIAGAALLIFILQKLGLFKKTS